MKSRGCCWYFVGSIPVLLPRRAGNGPGWTLGEENSAPLPSFVSCCRVTCYKQAADELFYRKQVDCPHCWFPDAFWKQGRLHFLQK